RWTCRWRDPPPPACVPGEGFTPWDAIRHLEEPPPPPDSHLKVRPPVTTFIDHIELSGAERDVIRGAESRMTVAQLLDDLPHRDLETYRALLGLIDKGFVEVIEEDVETQPHPVPQPNGAR